MSLAQKPMGQTGQHPNTGIYWWFIKPKVYVVENREIRPGEIWKRV